MKKLVTPFLVVGAVTALVAPASADNVFQALPFSQNWSNVALITANDNWSGVPGVIGYIGDSDPSGSVTAVDPTTLTSDIAVAVDVIAQALTTNTSGGVGEFDGLANPTVGLQGSGTADAPYLLLHVVSTGLQNITLTYNVRDIDGTSDNAVQQVAAQYRVGTSGAWTNIPGTYTADGTLGPSLSGQSLPIAAVLPAGANNQAQLQIRILTTNAASNDEWVGIDDITVTGTDIPVPTMSTTWGTIKALYR